MYSHSLRLRLREPAHIVMTVKLRLNAVKFDLSRFGTMQSVSAGLWYVQGAYRTVSRPQVVLRRPVGVLRTQLLQLQGLATAVLPPLLLLWPAMLPVLLLLPYAVTIRLLPLPLRQQSAMQPLPAFWLLALPPVVQGHRVQPQQRLQLQAPMLQQLLLRSLLLLVQVTHEQKFL